MQSKEKIPKNKKPAMSKAIVSISASIILTMGAILSPLMVSAELIQPNLTSLESKLTPSVNNNQETAAQNTTTASAGKKIDAQALLTELNTLVQESRARLDKPALSPSAHVQLNLDRVMIIDTIRKLDEEQEVQKKNGRSVDYKTEDAYIKGKEIIEEVNKSEHIKAYAEVLKPFDILADGSAHKAEFLEITTSTETETGTKVRAIQNLENDMIAIIDLTKATGGVNIDGKTGTDIRDVLLDSQATKDFIFKYKDDMVNILNITAPKYTRWMESNGHDMVKFKDEANRWGTMLSELGNAMGIIIDFSGNTFKDNTAGGMIDVKSDLTPLLINQDLELTPLGAELFGWTACLTPFQTNVNDYSNRLSLSEEARQIYDMYSKHRTPVYSVLDNSNIVQGLRNGTSYELGNITLRDVIEKVDKGDLVFYMSTLGEAEVNDIKLKNVNGSQSPSYVSNSDKFVGPVYYASGNTNINFQQKLDNPTMVKVGKDNPLIGKMTKSDLHMNYVTLYNHIKEERYYMSAIEEDLDKALYFDFMGNIVTEGGYVVVSAASNPVMYTAKSTPIMTASWINGYPRTQVQSDSRVKLMYGDKEKYTLGMKESLGTTYYAMLKVNEKGNGFGTKLDIIKPLSNADKKNENSVDLLPAEGFMSINKSYTMGNDYKIFANASSSVTYYDGDKIRKVNVASISTEGGDSSWNFIINQIGIMIDSQKNMVNTPLLAHITNIIPKCSQSGPLMLTNEVISKAGSDNFNAINNFLGSILEGLNNNLMNKTAQNGTFYNPMESASELGFEVKLIPILILSIVAALFIILITAILGVFRRDYVGIDYIKAIVTLALAAMYIVYGLEPTMDLLFNSIPNRILTDEVSVMSLYNIEDQYKEQDKRYFSSIMTKDQEFESDITLEKISSREAKVIRESDGTPPELKFLYYLPEFDRRPFNLIGQSVFLQGKYMKVKVKDLFEMSVISDKSNEDDLIELEHGELEEAGYVANYIPYFNFIDSLTHTLNAYSAGTNSGYKTLHYQKGVTKSTGRASDYFRSVFFLAPELLNEYVESTVEEFNDSLNKIETTDNSTSIESTGANSVTAKPGEKTDTDEGDSLVGENGEDLTIDGKTTQYNEDLLAAADYMISSMGSLEDWLGIRNRVLFLEPQNDTEIESRDFYQANKWYPAAALQYEYDDTARMLIDSKIETINENTRNFVITYLESVSNRVSDENLIKIVALYATMEFNKQFSDMLNQIYPKHINSIGMPNDTVTKFQYFNSYENFNNITSRISYVIAKKADWGGLLLAITDRIATLAKVVIKVTLLSLIPLMPFIMAFLLSTGIGRKKRILDKVINTFLILIGVYYMDILAVKISVWMVNKFGGMVGIYANLIISILTLILFYKIVYHIWIESPYSLLSGIQAGFSRTYQRTKGVFNRVVFGTPIQTNYYNAQRNQSTYYNQYENNRYDQYGYNNYGRYGDSRYEQEAQYNRKNKMDKKYGGNNTNARYRPEPEHAFKQSVYQAPESHTYQNNTAGSSDEKYRSELNSKYNYKS